MNTRNIIKLVKDAGRLVFDSELRGRVSMKGDADFLTEVDLAISSFIKKKLHESHPSIGFMSEEEDNGELKSQRFILDPIDGTTNLVYGYGLSSVSLAYCNDGVIEFGVVHNPYNKETFFARRGRGAFLNGRRLQVNNHPIGKSIIEFGAGSTKKQFADYSFALGRDIFKDCVDLRRICSSALAICYIAAGRIDGYFERVLKPWDYAAASLILSEAGGICTDWQNNKPQFEVPTTIIASNGQIHSYLYEKVNDPKYAVK